MPVDWPFPGGTIRLGGIGENRLDDEDGARQQMTAQTILRSLEMQPGIILADEVGMGKTYVALAVAAAVLLATRGKQKPVIVMVPRGLAKKWRREWKNFRKICVTNPEAFGWVRDRTIKNPTEFFQALSESPSHRPHLIWTTTGCFSKGLNDPWIKLALIRLARSDTKMTAKVKNRLYKWASTLTRLRTYRGLTPAVIKRLMSADIASWRGILVRKGVLSVDAPDPVPWHLWQHRNELDWRELNSVIRGGTIPGKRGKASVRRLRTARQEFSAACKGVYQEWLRVADWRASLLILDEAHHAKNDNTRLGRLLRSEDSGETADAAEPGEDVPLFRNKFDRMLFLTATPFQLGHKEIIRVLSSFASARWTGESAPANSRDEFLTTLKELEKRLDDNRIAARRLDRLWGRLQPDRATSTRDSRGTNPVPPDAWWDRLRSQPAGPFEEELVKSVEACIQTKNRAQNDPDRPWAALNTWVIRHNRPASLPQRVGQPLRQRREHRQGASIRSVNGANPAEVGGLSIGAGSAAPFLLAARAQGELAAAAGRGRAFFVEGLCSSYEAFHHTRDAGGDTRDVDDEGLARDGQSAPKSSLGLGSIVPIGWYEDQIEKLIPSKSESLARRYTHPKMSAVVDAAVKLWVSGEKVLIFCFYRETAKALRVHLMRELNRATNELLAGKLGLHAGAEAAKIEAWVARTTRRLGDAKSPFHRAIRLFLARPFQCGKFKILEPRSSELIGLLEAYMRSPSFVARYMPLEIAAVRQALGTVSPGRAVTQAGVEALTAALATQTDASGLTAMGWVEEFLHFCSELAARADELPSDADDGQADEDEASDPLREYLRAIAVHVRARGSGSDFDSELQRESRRGSFRVLPTVRMVYGDTQQEVRDRVMLAFNSPLFPEILVSSAVLGEGVDLHRFCRYVIHHDLCWNPSTLEQRTGRLDRIRCKAETTGHPIVIFEPYIAGSADERMYRVVRDRERWFQIVMGQKFEFDEHSAEETAGRVPLPDSLARELVFDLRRYRSRQPDAPTCGGATEP